MSKSKRRKSIVDRLPLLLVGMGFVILLIWIGLVAIRGFALYQSLDELHNLAETIQVEQVNQLDIDRIEELVVDARKNIVGLRSTIGPLINIAPYFSWIPEVGPLISFAPELMEMADSGSEAAVELIAGLKPAFPILQGMSGADPSSISQLLGILAAAEPNIQSAIASVGEMREARADIDDTSELPWRLRTLLETFDKELSLVEDGLRLSSVAPEILGANGRRSYLIMAQNEDELRPTGGYISGAGLLAVENGQIVSIDFSDASVVDDWKNKPYDFPPQPFFEIMGMDIFLFRDVNFWPDFPKTANAAMDLYSYGQDVPVDGVIAIDQEFIKMLLSAVGPLFVPEFETTLAANNVISEMRTQWEPSPDSDGSWILERKAFMGPMANALRKRLESETGSFDLVGLIRSMHSAADQRHLQFYVRDAEAAEVLREAGWDGHFANETGQDYLLVVDTSMGFNKVSAIIEREIDYHVTLSEEGSPLARLAIQYTHSGQPSEVACEHGTSYTNQTRYSDMFDDCYWNYVRVYAPLGSELQSSSSHPVPNTQLLSGQGWEGSARYAEEQSDQFKVFDTFYLIGQGQQLTGQFQYALPNTVNRSADGETTYALQVAEQAGLGPQAVRIRVTMPSGAEYVSASPEPVEIDGQDVYFSEIVTSDTLFSVTYE